MTSPEGQNRTVDGVLIGSLAAGAGAAAVVLLVVVRAPLPSVALGPAFLVAGILARKAPGRRSPQIALAALCIATAVAVVAFVRG